MCWRIKKALYGLRTAPRRWQEHLVEILEAEGLTQSKVDTCLLTKEGIALCYHVDDILVTGGKGAVSSFMRSLGEKLDIKQ